MANIALMTIGILRGPSGDPQVQGFIDSSGANFEAAEASPGFIDRSRFDELTDDQTWKGRSYPTIFQDEAFSDITPQTLSLWQDIESVFAFAYYNSVHAVSLSKRKEWFEQPKWPTYVAWWVADEHTPAWEEAYKRYDKLHQEGSSPEAFDFKHPFGPDGRSIKVDREVARKKVAQGKVSNS